MWAEPEDRLSGNSQQDGVAVKFKKLLLAFGEGPYVDRPLRFNAHPVQRGLVRDRRDDEIPGILKPDKSTVEQMVDTRRQEQTVLTVETFFIRGISPRFAVARQ